MDLSKSISEKLVRMKMDKLKEGSVTKELYKKVEDLLNHRLSSYETNVYVDSIEIVSETPESLALKVDYTVDVKIPILDPEDHSVYHEYDNEYRTQTIVLEK